MRNAAYVCCLLTSLFWAGCGDDKTAKSSPDPAKSEPAKSEPEKNAEVKPPAPTSAPGFLELTPKEFNQQEGIYWLNADQYGLEGQSFILAPMPLHGGPTLHTHHDSDEYHVVMEGKATYVLGNIEEDTLSLYEAEGPFVARIPQGTPHAVENTSHDGSNINVIGIFPTDHIHRGGNFFHDKINGVEISQEKYKDAHELIEYLKQHFDIKPASEAPLLKPKPAQD